MTQQQRVTRSIKRSAILAVVLSGALAGCSDGSARVDAGRDTLADQQSADAAGGDLPPPDQAPVADAPSPDLPDAAPDSIEAPVADAAPDAPDAPADEDAAPDVTADVPADVPAEAAPEVAPDVPIEAAPEVAPDVPIERAKPVLPPTAFHWPNNIPPTSNPFATSTSIKEIIFTGRHALYGAADTFIPTWGSDGDLYTPFTYGTVGGVDARSWFGWAKFTGDDPLKLNIAAAGVIDMGSNGPHYGAFPAASVILKGVWFYGGSAEDGFNGTCGFWCIAGPFMGFWTSTDYGAHWTPPPNGYANSLFGENNTGGAKIKFGQPRAVDFGKEMSRSPDGKTYFIASGATDPAATDNWVTADQLYMARVALSPATANDASAWEFFAGRDGNNQPIWSSSFASIKPLVEWKNQLGSLWMTYIAPLGKFLLVSSRPHDGFNNYGSFDTVFLESDSLTGPFKMVQYLNEFGVQAYDVTVPSKFISDDGQTMWIEYSSGDYTTENPPGSRYAMSFQEIVLDLQ